MAILILCYFITIVCIPIEKYIISQTKNDYLVGLLLILWYFHFLFATVTFRKIIVAYFSIKVVFMLKKLVKLLKDASSLL